MIPSSRLLFRQISKQSISVNCYSVQTVKLPKQHEWNRAVASAEKMVGFPTSLLNLQSLMNDDVTGKASFYHTNIFLIRLNKEMSNELTSKNFKRVKSLCDKKRLGYRNDRSYAKINGLWSSSIKIHEKTCYSRWSGIYLILISAKVRLLS